MLHANQEAMESPFAAFRPVAAGQPLNQGVGTADKPPPRDHKQGEVNELTPDNLRSMESAGRAPYSTRLRVILALALFSWAIIALIAWAIARF